MTTKFTDALRQQIDALIAERAALVAESETLDATDETRTAEQLDARADEIIARCKAIDADVAAKEARHAELVALEAERNSVPKAPAFVRQPEAVAPTDVRSMKRAEARDAAMRVLDGASERMVSARAKEAVANLVDTHDNFTDGDAIARRLLLTENDQYRSAFVKVLRDGNLAALTPEESRAVNEFRTQNIATDTSGGFGIPVLIDPTIIVTTGTTASPLLNAMQIKTITNDVWRGVSAAGVAWSFDAESAEVSDDTVTFAQPTVQAHMARGYVPYSIEFGQDYPNAAGELGRLLTVGYDDLLANKLATGTGTNEPWGIFVALDANTNAEVTVTTNAAFGDVDIDKVWAALPEKWRSRASWFMSVGYENKVRAFGSGTATSRFTVDQTREGISLLNGRPVILSDYAPAVATSTTARNILCVGDFSNYVLAQRAGMSVEVVPHVIGTTNNRPTGERALFAYARVGADSVLDTAFRLLTNT